MNDSFWQRLRVGGQRWRQRADWPRFAGEGWRDHIMEVSVTDRFHAKQGRSTGRWILHADGQRLAVYLKRHYRLEWWRGLLATLFPNRGWSPALEEWRHLEWAQTQGIPVPATVAAVEYIGPWGRFQSFLAIEELAGMLPLNEAIPLAAQHLSPHEFRLWKREMVAELVRLTREIHDRRWFHKDLYLCHFYISAELCEMVKTRPGNWDALRGKIHLIDLHRLTHYPWTWPIWQVKDLAQLLYSSEVEGVEDRDRLRFWRHYRGHRRFDLFSRWLRGAILFKWRRYRRHNAKKHPLTSTLEQG
jgi:hypothetical protein